VLGRADDDVVDEVAALSPMPPGVLRESLKSESRVDIDFCRASVIGLGAASMSGIGTEEGATEP